MNYKMMGRFIGKILIVEAVFMVPAMLISLWEREFGAVIAFMWSLAAILAAAGGLTLLLRRLLHGFSPEELVRTYLTQNEVLGDLDEGIIAADSQGVVQLVNRAAEAMLGQRAERLAFGLG